MAGEMLRAFKAADGMEPIALLDYFVKIITFPHQDRYRKVDFLESISPFQVLNLGALAANTVSARLSISAGQVNSNFDLATGEFAQWRWFPLDNFMARLFLPSGVAKTQMKFIQLGVEKSIINRDPLLVSTEFFSWEDQRPAFEAMNFSNYALLATRIIALGYRFHTAEASQDEIEQIKNGRMPCTPVLCTGRA